MFTSPTAHLVLLLVCFISGKTIPDSHVVNQVKITSALCVILCTKNPFNFPQSSFLVIVDEFCRILEILIPGSVSVSYTRDRRFEYHFYKKEFNDCVDSIQFNWEDLTF